MRWTKELDEKLKFLINQGKRHNEIGLILNKTKKSVSCRCDRLGIKILFQETLICKQCGKIFSKRINDIKIFCSSSCSTTFNNKKRIRSEESKNKLSEKFTGKNNPNWKNGNSIKKSSTGKKRTPTIEKIKMCKICGNEKILIKHKRICDKCKYEYYKVYHPLCSFDFKIKNFSSFFDMSLVEKYGWYSPSNKGNNLLGVSKDHIYSVKDGFINKVNPNIIKHPANCNLMIHTDNNKKKDKSLISLDELLLKIKIWDEINN
jgi:hypothetical protein